MKKVLSLLVILLFIQQVKSQTDTTSSAKEGTVIPTFTLTETDLSNESQSQDVSGLLQASRDIFVSTAGYVFGPARYRVRGYDSQNLTVLMDGITLNDPETGRAYWSSWGGLNDITRYNIVQNGIVSSEYGFGGVGGITEINARPSTFRKQVKFSYSLSNRSYRNRMMFTYSTGVMPGGWSLIASFSRRWAQEGYVEGTFYDAWAYFLGVEKKLTKNNSLTLTIFGSPTKRGKSGIAVQEAYNLTGNNYYNPYWGYQAGKKRNARVNNYHQPMITLTDYWKLSDKTKVKLATSYWFGKGSSSALNWVEANDPRPDYYRYLPSWYYLIGDSATGDYAAEQWRTNVNYRQINWDALYFANSKFLYTVNNVDGIKGNNVTGLRSKYIIEDRRNDKSQLQVNGDITSFVNTHISLYGGFNLNFYKGHQYKKIDDLLGGEFWLDIDKYASGDPFKIPAAAQSDLNHPNRIVKEGDIFGYDYDANIQSQKIFGEADFSYHKVDFYFGAKFTHTNFWRTGHMRNGHFPLHSYGEGHKNNFYNYGLKGGVTYKINGRNYITGNLMYMTRAPYFRDAYISVRTRDFTVDNLKSETIYSGDINYVLRTPAVKARLTFYYTQFKDKTWLRSFYHEGLNSFVNYIMTGVDELNTGMELGLEANLSPTISVSGVLGIGQNIYTSRPSATITQDNDARLLAHDRKVYLENYYVGGMPQTVASVGIRYNAPKYWFIGINGNYFGNSYLPVNPDRHTKEALEGLAPDDYRIPGILAQEKLPDGMTVDMFGGKSWRIHHKYTTGFSVSISNLLNNTGYISGGYEQLRYDPRNINKFPPKYAYLYGRTFFLNIYFRM
jgi:hypothetical protein